MRKNTDFLDQLTKLSAAQEKLRSEELIPLRFHCQFTRYRLAFYGTRRLITAFMIASHHFTSLSGPHSQTILRKIHFNNILSHTPRPSEWSRPLRLYRQSFGHFSCPPHASHISFSLIMKALIISDEGHETCNQAREIIAKFIPSYCKRMYLLYSEGYEKKL